MRKITSYLSAMFAVVLILSSCSKQETYPSLLEGAYVGYNASTGYTAGLVIQTIAGGQYAYFAVSSPTVENFASVEGSFVYDSSTGTGSIQNKMTGALSVKVQAQVGTDERITVSATQVVSGGAQTYFEGEMQKGTIVQ